MPIPPLPPDIEQIGRRHFSFYPPILGFEHNEWLHGSTNWSEIQVINARTGTEAWIPRRFLGQISCVDDPVLIVGLTRELEFREGSIWPYRRRVIELPVAVNGAPSGGVAPRPATVRHELAPVVNIRLEPEGEARKGRNLIVLLMLGAVACSVVLGVARSSRVRARPDPLRMDSALLRLTGADRYAAVVQKLGPPTTESVLEGPGGVSYWTLAYPKLHCNVILIGQTRAVATYFETIDQSGRVMHPAEGLRKTPEI